MREKQYILSAKTAILNRVRFHAPIVFDDRIDWKELSSHGIDGTKPLFKFEKALSRPLLKAFLLAMQEEDFCLVLSLNALSKLKEIALKKLPNVTVFDPEKCSKSFLETVNKLNINYPSCTNYNLVYKERFFKVDGQPLNPHFENFFLRSCRDFGNLEVDYFEFVLNGNNFYASLKNKSAEPKKVRLELNIPLEKGYYYFKHLSKAICVENLLTKEKNYLNFFCRNAKFSFSNVDGLENSAFSCVHVKLTLTILPCEESFVFFNYGQSRFLPKNKKEILLLKELSSKKVCEIFDVQVKTKEPKFDFFFNKTLPKKIWTNWLNGEPNLELEQKYVAYRRLFLRGSLANAPQEEKGVSLVKFRALGLKELGIFNGEYYKKINVVSGDEQFFKVGKTVFYNARGITETSLKSRQPISVCFGD